MDTWPSTPLNILQNIQRFLSFRVFNRDGEPFPRELGDVSSAALGEGFQVGVVAHFVASFFFLSL